MEKQNHHRTPEEKLAIIEYAEKNGMNRACEKYQLTERSIWRYKSLYDGTLQSLENGSSVPASHPNQHTETEIKNIKEVLEKHPYISVEELYKILTKEYGYNRTKPGLLRYLRKRNLIPETKQKNDYVNIFDKTAIDMLNKQYAFSNRNKLPIYVIELNTYGIYLSSISTNNPCNLTVYYSTALKFNSLEEAKAFLKTIKIKTQFKPNIKEIRV